jgi:hypothetical protein
MNDTPTPRTDAIKPTQERKRNALDYIIELEDHAKQLERELSEIAKSFKEKRCEFCGELPQTENEKAYASEFGDKKGKLPTMDEIAEEDCL